MEAYPNATYQASANISFGAEWDWLEARSSNEGSKVDNLVQDIPIRVKNEERRSRVTHA